MSVGAVSLWCPPQKLSDKNWLMCSSETSWRFPFTHLLLVFDVSFMSAPSWCTSYLTSSLFPTHFSNSPTVTPSWQPRAPPPTLSTRMQNQRSLGTSVSALRRSDATRASSGLYRGQCLRSDKKRFHKSQGQVIFLLTLPALKRLRLPLLLQGTMCKAWKGTYQHRNLTMKSMNALRSQCRSDNEYLLRF